MKCQCEKGELTLWQGTGEIGYGCKECKTNWLPNKYIKGLALDSKFKYSDFAELIKTAQSSETTMQCPHGCCNLTNKHTAHFDVNYCHTCHGILMTEQQAKKFYAHYKIPSRYSHALLALEPSILLALMS